MIYWLKNRMPDKWRDKKEIDGRLKVEEVVISVDGEEYDPA